MTDDHRRLIVETFGDQAARFDRPGLVLSDQALFGWVVEALQARAGERALDVATGTGHLARALAKAGLAVIGADLTLRMLLTARDQAAREGLSGLALVGAAAEALPFADGAFDLVACRFALHHYPDPAPALAEMARLCRRHAGRVGIVDLIAPEDGDAARRYNDFERLRDRSHCRALSLSELARALEVAGLTVRATDRKALRVDSERWLSVAATPEPARAEIDARLTEALAGRGDIGTEVFAESGRPGFVQQVAVLLATRR